MAEAGPRSRRVVTVVSALAGLAMLVGGVWSWAGTRSFAEFANFGHHEHFLHDLGAFQIGIGVMVLLALIWADAPATALAGLFVANTLHVVNHVIDLSHGGFAWQAWALGAVSVAVAVALVLRVWQLGSVLGAVTVSTDPTLERFLRQKTINVTTYRADGTPRSTPVSIAVHGDHAYLRSFAKAAKTRRVRRDPHVEVTPSTAFGRVTGPALAGHLRLLHGDESRRAARLIARKYPFLHGVLVPLAHRVLRRRTGRTVHFEFVPSTPRANHESPEEGRATGSRWPAGAGDG